MRAQIAQQVAQRRRLVDTRLGSAVASLAIAATMEALDVRLTDVECCRGQLEVAMASLIDRHHGVTPEPRKQHRVHHTVRRPQARSPLLATHAFDR